MPCVLCYHMCEYVWADTVWNIIVMEELALPLVARLRAFLSTEENFIQSFHEWMRRLMFRWSLTQKRKVLKRTIIFWWIRHFYGYLCSSISAVCVQHRVTLQFLQLYRDVPLSHRSILLPWHNTRHTMLEWLCGVAGNMEKVNNDRKRCDNGESETASRKRYEQNLVIFNLISLL